MCPTYLWLMLPWFQKLCIWWALIKIAVVNNAAFLWARKVVFMTLPVGNSIPLKSEVVITTGKVGQADITPSCRVERKWQPPYELEGKILDLPYCIGYTRKVTLYLTVWDNVGIADFRCWNVWHFQLLIVTDRDEPHTLLVNKSSGVSDLEILYFRSRNYEIPSPKESSINCRCFAVVNCLILLPLLLLC